jgi:hypothetical protein
MSSETVVRMCIACCRSEYGAFACIVWSTQWMISSLRFQISLHRGSASTERRRLHQSVRPAFFDRPSDVLHRSSRDPDGPPFALCLRLGETDAARRRIDKQRVGGNPVRDAARGTVDQIGRDDLEVVVGRMRNDRLTCGRETNDRSSAHIVQAFSEDTIFRSFGPFLHDNCPQTRARIEIVFKCRKLPAALSLPRARLATDLPQLSTKSRCPRVARARRIGSMLAEIAGSGYAAMTRSGHRRWRRTQAGTAARTT